ncbi:MAG: prolyl oligopeptidase family serine peptidase [Bacillota bacterium]
MGQAVCTFSRRGELIYRYLLFLPEGYAESRGAEGRKWPLILFLHGIGERGDDPEVLKAYGPPKWASEHPDFPFVVVSPQCPASSHWVEGDGEIEKLHALLDEITSAYSVDPDRVYVTGLSMGGRGTWAMAIQRPERFAAIAPVCGRSDPEKAYLLKDLPVWVFHGAKDEVVPLEKAEEIVKALRACGGNVRFAVYPDAGHDAWTLTYGNPELYDWFLQHSRGKQGAGELQQAAR